jgi:hypothetical protein
MTFPRRHSFLDKHKFVICYVAFVVTLSLIVQVIEAVISH